MELNKLEFSLRARGPWEAIDLGFALARRWFYPLWLLWLCTALPLGLLLCLLLNEDSWLLALAFWWFKPLYEPALLFWMSRSVFGERLSVRAVMRQWWLVVKPQLFANLTWRRFNPGRSFTMPVALLERLTGKARRDRIRILGHNQHQATWLTVVGFHLETVLELAFITTLFALIPEDLRWINLEQWLLAPGRVEEWLQLIGVLLCMSLIAPFYVAAGFALYLHRRSELEAWDIEINFRKMNERMSKARQTGKFSVLSLLMVTVLLVGTLQPEPVLANNLSAEQAKPVIEAVLADEAFGKHQQQAYWKYIGDNDQPDNDENSDQSWLLNFIVGLFKILSGFLQGYATVGKALIWGGGIALVAYFIYRIAPNQGWFSGAMAGRQSRQKSTPVELFGLDIRPDQLPEDPANEARRLVEAGDLRGALSLLYRGALMCLVSGHHIEIPDSATEGECVQLVNWHRGDEEADYFRHLTNDWLKMAYAHIAPPREQLLNHCTQWQGVYGDVQG